MDETTGLEPIADGGSIPAVATTTVKPRPTRCLSYDDPILGECRPIHVTKEGRDALVTALNAIVFDPPVEADPEAPAKKAKKG